MADNLLTRDEVLGGLPAKRASALLYLVESRTAQLVDRARHLMVPFRSEDAAQERELAFVEAFAIGREPPLRPTIQDLERHAPQWAELVPANPRLRAAVAHQFGQKYQFAREDVPSLRAALGLDDPAVQGAYARLYSEPLEGIYTRDQSLGGRLRWAGAALSGWVDSLPPFWTAFALTLTETVGAGILALPIALATVGPLAGVVMLVILGLVNVITVAWIAESAARTANIRYGGAYFGRFVTEYLGSASSVLLVFALVVNCAALWIAYAIGLAATLASATGIAAAIWVAVLFAVGIYMISRDTLSSTVASALGFGALNLVLIGGLAVLGVFNLSTANLSRVEIPGVGGTPFEVSFIGLIFGVILISYFGHTSVGNCAAIVLKRDPSARSLIWGAAAAQVVAIAVYSTWVLAINGSIAPEALAGHAGTALDPLAEMAGQGVYVVGSVFVVAAMGMASIYQGMGLVNVVRERLPRQSRPVVLLPRRHGQVVLTPRGGAGDRETRLILSYLGVTNDGQPRFLVRAQVAGESLRVTMTSAAPWSAREACARLPEDPLDELDLRVETIDADENQARLRITSNMRVKVEGTLATTGVDLAGLLDDDGDTDGDPDAALLRWMLRQGEASPADAAAWAGEDERQMRERLRGLVQRGDAREVRRGRSVVYRATVARRRARNVPDGLPGMVSANPSPQPRAMAGAAVREGLQRASDGILSARSRVILEYAPLVAVFLATEWLVLSGRASFTLLLSFAGVVSVPIFAGIFPCLLIQSSRRKGDLVPGTVSRLLGQPWLTLTVYALFLIGILLHGLLIWERPGERVAAIVAGAIVLLVTVVAIRRGALDHRTVVMVRDDKSPDGAASMEVVSGGCPVAVEAQVRRDSGVEHVSAAAIDLPDLAGLREITAGLPADQSRGLKVWANRITPEGDTECLPARVRLSCDGEERVVDLRVAGGEAFLPRPSGACGFAIEFDQPSAPAAPVSTDRPARRGRVDLDSLLSAASDADTAAAKGD